MKWVTKSLTILMICSMTLTAQGSELPKVRAKGAVLIEAESGRVLYEKNGFESMPMASTTKIMTCIVALEEGKLDDIVTTSKRASRAPEVKLHLKEGEKQRLGDLLYALMLQSNNDAAVAIAEHISGSVEAFCNHMTERAKELGATHTAFKTPNGLDADGHFASPYDLAIISAYALKNPEFVKIITTTNITIPTIATEGSHVHDLQNKNRFLYSYEGADGIKTGFTNKAGHCFVGAAHRNGMQLIGTALASGWGKAGKTQKYTDVINMMNYGFANYQKYTLVEPKKDYCKVPITKALQDEVSLDCEKQVVMPLTEREKENITIKTLVPEGVVAPVQKGEEIGELQVICEGVVLAKVPLKVQEDVKKASVIDYIKKWLKLDETKE